MNKYLYIFSYQKPEQRSPQDTLALFIEAQSEHEALVWGREISEELTRRLFHNPKASWKQMRLPHCIADESFLVMVSSPNSGAIPVVPCGQYPDFTAINPSIH